MKIITNKPIRAYCVDKSGKLKSCGGFAKDKVLLIDALRPKTFSNAEYKALPVMSNERVFILGNSDNYTVVADNYNASGARQDCNISSFTDKSITTYDDCNRTFCDDFAFYYGTDSWVFNDWQLTDYLSDDVYFCDEQGFKTVAEIEKMSRKQRKKYNRAVRAHKRQGKAEQKVADADETKVFNELLKTEADANKNRKPIDVAALIKQVNPEGAQSLKLQGGDTLGALKPYFVGAAVIFTGLIVVLVGYGISKRMKSKQDANAQ